MRSFGSDNHSGVHPDIMTALAQANSEHAASYGQDAWTDKAGATFKKHFGDDAELFFVFNGTAANVLSIAALVKPYESVLCSDVAHLAVDECGAPERFLGSKLITLPHVHGKVTIAEIEKCLIRGGDQHFSQPRVVSITQPTELGTVYTLDELKALTDFAHSKGLKVHMDGSRLNNAVVSLGTTFKDITRGVDALSYGGTKNGMVFGEAIVLFGKHPDMKYIRKQAMQLASKSRFIAAQFQQMLGTDLWEKNAKHVLKMAKRLEAGVKDIPGVRITQAVQSNAVFAIIPWPAIKKARESYFFYVWDEHTGEVRWMTSFDTSEADVDAFVQTVRAAI